MNEEAASFETAPSSETASHYCTLTSLIDHQLLLAVVHLIRKYCTVTDGNVATLDTAPVNDPREVHVLPSVDVSTVKDRG